MSWLNQTLEVLVALLPGGVLAVWCIWAVNWKKTWPVLAVGGWIPLVLVLLMTAKVWSLIDRRPLTIAGVTLHNYWWQLGATGILAGFALFCGYLQGQWNCEPESISLDPPDSHDDHGHDGHGHGH